MGVIMGSLSGTVGLPVGRNVIRLSRLVSLTAIVTETSEKSISGSAIRLFIFMNTLIQRPLVAELFSLRLKLTGKSISSPLSRIPTIPNMPLPNAKSI